MAMKVAIALASAVLSQANIMYVQDFFHYKDNTTRVKDESCNGIAVDRWEAIGQEPHLATLNPTNLQRITLPKDGTFPAKNGAKPYWLLGEAWYVVTQGNATFQYANGTEHLLQQGDLFYTPAGMHHGPIKNAAKGDTVILALTDLTTQNVDETISPALLPTNEDFDAYGMIPPKQFAFQPREYPVQPGDLPACIKLEVLKSATSTSPQAIAAKMTPDCTLPFHFHATGVFYFFTKGTLRVSNDLTYAVDFPAGTARWARPGWSYGPESSLEEEVRFIVLGLPPTVGYADPEATEFVIANDLPNAAQVAYKNTQYNTVPDSGAPETPAPEALPQKRVRRHLRAKTTEHEESVFLQTPMHHDDALDDEDDAEELAHHDDAEL